MGVKEANNKGVDQIADARKFPDWPGKIMCSLDQSARSLKFACMKLSSWIVAVLLLESVIGFLAVIWYNQFFHTNFQAAAGLPVEFYIKYLN